MQCVIHQGSAVRVFDRTAAVLNLAMERQRLFAVPGSRTSEEWAPPRYRHHFCSPTGTVQEQSLRRGPNGGASMLIQRAGAQVEKAHRIGSHPCRFQRQNPAPEFRNRRSSIGWRSRPPATPTCGEWRGCADESWVLPEGLWNRVRSAVSI